MQIVRSSVPGRQEPGAVPHKIIYAGPIPNAKEGVCIYTERQTDTNSRHAPKFHSLYLTDDEVNELLFILQAWCAGVDMVFDNEFPARPR